MELTSPEGSLMATFEYNMQTKVVKNIDSYTKSSEIDPFTPSVGV